MKITISNSSNDFQFSVPGFWARVLIMTLAVILAAWILPGVDIKGGALAAALTALVISLLNNFLRPVLVFLTLPFTILTMGLFLFVVNAVIVWLASKLLPQFEVETFGWALLFSLLITALNYIFELPDRMINRRQFDNSSRAEDNTEYTDYEEVE